MSKLQEEPNRVGNPAWSHRLRHPPDLHPEWHLGENGDYTLTDAMSKCPNCGSEITPGSGCAGCRLPRRSQRQVTVCSTQGAGRLGAEAVTLDLPLEFLARYEVSESLGRGGMGEVLRARDLELGQDVAIKFCVTHSVPGARERFEREASLMARIRHPNVVTILSTGVVEKIPYFVMPLVEGSSLRQKLASCGSLSLDEAVTLTEQILEGLDAAHHEGVIHRDLKPENVLVTPQGQAMLLDLGVAKSWADGSALKDTAQITGTPTYMSPEQAKGLPTGVASDLYSVGVILFEMIAGRPPFSAPTAVGVLKAHMEARIPRITEFCPTLSAQWDHLLARALAKSPADRFADAKSFSMALEKATVGQYSVTHLPVFSDLEPPSLSLLPRGPLANSIGLSILSMLGLIELAGLLTVDISLTLAALLPLFSTFFCEEPGRFSQLTARDSIRCAVYAVTGLVTMYLALLVIGGAALDLNLVFCSLAGVHLASFGGYHARPPDDRAGARLHRRANVPIMLLTFFIVLSQGNALAAGLTGAAFLISLLGLTRAPARTRHLPLGTATTLILLPRLARQKEESTSEDSSKERALRLAPASATKNAERTTVKSRPMTRLTSRESRP